MGQIVKTWVKVLGLNDPYGRHIESGLKADIGQIVIYFYLFNDNHIFIYLYGANVISQRLNRRDNLTIWPMFTPKLAGISHAKKKKPSTKYKWQFDLYLAKWQFDPCHKAVTIWPMFTPRARRPKFKWQYDNMTHKTPRPYNIRPAGLRAPQSLIL